MIRFSLKEAIIFIFCLLSYILTGHASVLGFANAAPHIGAVSAMGANIILQGKNVEYNVRNLRESPKFRELKVNDQIVDHFVVSMNNQLILFRPIITKQGLDRMVVSGMLQNDVIGAPLSDNIFLIKTSKGQELFYNYVLDDSYQKLQDGKTMEIKSLCENGKIDFGGESVCKVLEKITVQKSKDGPIIQVEQKKTLKAIDTKAYGDSTKEKGAASKPTNIAQDKFQGDRKFG